MKPSVPALLLRLILSPYLVCLGLQCSLPLATNGQTTADDRERSVMERFRAVLERTPRRGTALDRVYGYHVERGTLDALIKTYHDRTAADPHDGAAWLLLGLFEAQRGRDAAAVAALRRAEAQRNDDPLPAYYLGQALLLLGQPDAAALAFERALARNPARNDLLEIFQALGRVHQRAHRNDQALAVWTRLEVLFPDDARVQEQIAAALAEESQLEPALGRYEALAKTSRDPYRRVQFRLEAADLKVRLGRRTDALSDFEGLLGGLDPASWLYRDVRRRIEDVFLRNDDQAGLAGYYERWLKTTPDDVEAMVRLGRTLAAHGRRAESRTWLDRAVKIAPSRKELRMALIEQLVHDRKFTEAAAQYEAISRSDPNNPDVIRDWGRLLLSDTSRPEAERKQAARGVWLRLLEARPRDAALTARVADLFRQAGLIDEAIGLYRKAVALAPDAPQYREYLGEYYHALKRSGEALAEWRALAAGANRSARSLARLCEVLSGFGYKDEAIAAIADACALDTESLELRLKHAGLLLGVQRYGEALDALAVATRLAGTEDEQEAVLARQIAADQAANQLVTRIESLHQDVAGDRAGDAAAWRRLARYHEAARRGNEAIAAIDRAVALDPASVASWSTAARLYESAGRLAEAAAILRKLVALDRRAPTAHLTSIANLEARLGRRAEALQAGRDLLDSAPGNTEHTQFFADLCFRLGASEEGLETLRRGARRNENDPQALRSLAEALAREFRTEEAIELYWRTFERTNELDGKLGVVSRLAELYLQRNQFDRLIVRLERLQTEAGREREATFYVAQAHAAAGDFGTARQQVETLLASNPRDPSLLKQLSELAENEGDLGAAVKFQKQLHELAPGNEAATRLVQLALRAGDFEEAEAVWSRFAAGDHDLAQVLGALDSLMGLGKYDVVLTTTARLLGKSPDNWELLYREARALEALDRTTEAARRCQSLLDLRRDDDEVSAIVAAQSKKKPAGAVGVSLGARVSLLYRLNSSRYVRALLGMEYYPANALRRWAPNDFGQARMYALGLQMVQAQRENAEEAWRARLHQASIRAPNDRRPLWDELYVELLRSDRAAATAAARSLAQAAGRDPSADFAYLYTLTQSKSAALQQSRFTGEEVEDASPPLPPAEIDLIRDALVSVIRSKPVWIFPGLVDIALGELRRAGHSAELDAIGRDLVATASDVHTISAAAALAADHADFDGLMKLTEAVNRIPSGTRGTVMPGQAFYYLTPQGVVYLPIYFMARAIQRGKPDPALHARILRLLDDYRRADQTPARAAERLRAMKKTAPAADRNLYPVFMGSGVGMSAIPYPSPNAYLDQSAILLLRSVFIVFQRDDLVSDLLGNLRRQVGAPEADPGTALRVNLELSALLWWADEKDEALRALARAVALAPGDVELKLTMADLRTQRREYDEALAVVDSIEAVDQESTQRREMLALQVSVQTGNVERARQAAERLFGLRLDSSLQVPLAAQMHQLGMHELAEAVLARVRRRAGNNVEALVSLMLQYQRQGNNDAAVPIAHQILRRSTDLRSTARSDLDDPNKQQAIEVLARSGKLRALIERLEDQVRQAPQSLVLQQTLAAYYQAAGQRDKLRETTAAIINLRPDNVSLRVQLASQLMRSGDTVTALDHFRAVLKKNPAQFGTNFALIQVAFMRQNKVEELAALLEQTGLKAAMIDYYDVIVLVQALLRDPKTVDRGMKLFEKAWDAYPTYREYMLVRFIAIDEFWKRPESFRYAREGVIPAVSTSQVFPWSGLSALPASAWNDEGRVSTVSSRLLDAATRRNALEDLAREVEAAVERTPQWSAGRVLLGLIDARSGRAEEARKTLEPLLFSASAHPPVEALTIVGQELHDDPALQPLALKVYEKAQKNAGEWFYGGLGVQYGPLPHLARLYRRQGRYAEARHLVLQAATYYRELSLPAGNPALTAYRKLVCLNSVGEFFLELGLPADAVRVFSLVLGAGEEIQAARSYPRGDLDAQLGQARGGVDRALHGLNREALTATLDAMVPPPRANENPEGTSSGEPIDLLVAVHPRVLDEASVISLYPETLAMAARVPGMLPEVRSRLDAAMTARPDDLAALTASVLLECAGEDPKAIAEAANRLEAKVAGSPLETLSEGARPNARQRALAEPRVGLWLVARACWNYEQTRAIGERLATLALEGARRQADVTWTLAMLREWGQQAADRGDPATAESRWTAMLELTQSRLTVPRPVPAPARPQGAGRRASAAGNAPIATPERFEQASEIARLAAKHGLHDLSLRSVRNILQGGPPVVAVSLSAAGAAATRAALAGPAPKSPDQLAFERLVELESLWQRGGVSPSAIYETLRDVVLPATRPAEIFLYTGPLAGIDKAPAATRAIPPRPRSAGAMLARWAVAAGRSDDLRRRIVAHRAQPSAEVPALVLLSLLAQAEKAPEAIAASLDAIAQRLQKDTLQSSAELACHAALPALELTSPNNAGAALAVIDRAARALATGTDEEPVDSLLLALARFDFEHSGVTQGRARIEAAVSTAERATSRNALDDPLYRRKRAFAAAAVEYLRAGLWAEGLDLLGRFADGPTARGGDPPAGADLAVLARESAHWPAAARYERLKSWTLPAPGRPTTRVIAGFAPERTTSGSAEGIVDTASLLINAAREAGQLDQLGASLPPPGADGIDNARALRIIVEAARGRLSAAEPLVRALAADITRRVPEKTAVAPALVVPLPGMAPAWPDILVARACLADQALAPVGEAMARDLITHAERVHANEFKNRLVRIFAAARDDPQ